MKRILPFLVILTLFAQLLNAQNDVLFHNTKIESFEIKFKPQYSTSSLPNFFVDEIAKAIPKIRMYVKINYQYQLETKVKKNANKYKLYISIGQITYGGDFKYKSFDFSHLVAPSQIEQTFLIKDLSSNKTHYQKVIINFLENDSAQVAILDLKGVITYKVNVRAYSVKQIYLDKQKTKFQEAITSIDNYYDDELKLVALLERANAVSFEKADILALQNVDLKYIEKDLDKLRINDYRESLNLQAYDPIRLLVKYDTLLAIVSQKREIMNQKMGRLDQFYFDQAKEKIDLGDEKTAVEYFQKSIEINPYFYPSIYQMSLIDYQHKRYIKSFRRLSHILNDLEPNPESKKQMINLVYLSYDSVMQICLDLNNDEKYNQSIKLLYLTKVLCDSTKYIECDHRIDQYISQAIYGLYTSYLSIARASLDKGRLDMCQDYMEMANIFRKNNSDKLIGNFAEANSITSELIEGLVYQSEQENAIGNHSKAMQLLNDAKTLCNQNPSNGCKALINKKEAIVHKREYDGLINKSLHYRGTRQAQTRKEYLSLAITYQQLHSDYIPSTIGTDTIIGKVRFMMYQEYISNGLNAMESNNYTDAYIEYKEAKKLEDQYVLTKNEKLMGYIQESAKPIVLETLSNGSLKAWGKHYSEAALLLDSANKMTKEWHLAQDIEIKNATSKLEEELKKDICEKLADEYNNWIKKANTSLRFDDYYHASFYWKKAYTTAIKLPHCKLNSQQAQNQLQKYIFDIAYKKELHLADSLKTIDSKKSFEHLVNAEKIRLNKSSEMKSKSIKSLLDILIGYNNSELNILGIKYFNQENKIEDSYKLSIYALESHQEIDHELISETAHLLANLDFDSNSNDRMAEKRFGNKKELQGFKKAYLKAKKR